MLWHVSFFLNTKSKVLLIFVMMLPFRSHVSVGFVFMVYGSRNVPQLFFIEHWPRSYPSAQETEELMDVLLRMSRKKKRKEKEIVIVHPCNHIQWLVLTISHWLPTRILHRDCDWRLPLHNQTEYMQICNLFVSISFDQRDEPKETSLQITYHSSLSI